MDQALSLYLIETIPLMDSQAPDYALILLTLVESILEDPAIILRKQLDQVKDLKMAEMKNGIAIPAGKTVKLMPMGLHIMFQALKSHPKKGDMVNGTLTFAKAGTVKVEFIIEPSDAGMQ